MTKKVRIRMSRNNEINLGSWFLIICMAIFYALMLTVENIYEGLLILFVSLIILLYTLLYQGFELIKE